MIVKMAGAGQATQFLLCLPEPEDDNGSEISLYLSRRGASGSMVVAQHNGAEHNPFLCDNWSWPAQ